MDAIVLRNDVRRIETGEQGLVRRLLAHLPEEPAFRVGAVCRYVQRSFSWIKPSDDIQTWLVDGALGLFGVLQGHANLQEYKYIREICLMRMEYDAPGNLVLDAHPF